MTSLFNKYTKNPMFVLVRHQIHLTGLAPRLFVITDVKNQTFIFHLKRLLSQFPRLHIPCENKNRVALFHEQFIF